MPRPLRAEIFTSDKVSIVHCVQRCVRRSFLAGFDPFKKIDYHYRREWIRARIEKLASVFGVDCLTYAILSNHLHIVLRNRPDVVETWTDGQAALRWLQIFPGKRIDEQLGDPTEEEVDALANDAKRMKTIRARLSDFSWFMRALAEPIARRANMEDDCKGHFWESRFKATNLLDEASLLACCMYVDLNSIRAAMASNLESSTFTSAHDRMEASNGKKMASSAVQGKVISRQEAAEIRATSTPKQLQARRKAARNRKGPQVLKDAWLAPLTLNERTDFGPMASNSGVRASDKGFLSVNWKDYFQLLEWTARNGKQETRSDIPKHLVPLLTRLGLDHAMWCDLVWKFQKYFGKNGFAGSPTEMKEQAIVNNKAYLHGQHQAQLCYLT